MGVSSRCTFVLFNIIIACFYIVFYKVLRLCLGCYQRFFVEIFVFLKLTRIIRRCYLNNFDAFCVFCRRRIVFICYAT